MSIAATVLQMCPHHEWRPWKFAQETAPVNILPETSIVVKWWNDLSAEFMQDTSKSRELMHEYLKHLASKYQLGSTESLHIWENVELDKEDLYILEKFGGLFHVLRKLYPSYPFRFWRFRTELPKGTWQSLLGLYVRGEDVGVSIAVEQLGQEICSALHQTRDTLKLTKPELQKLNITQKMLPFLRAWQKQNLQPTLKTDSANFLEALKQRLGGTMESLYKVSTFDLMPPEGTFLFNW